MEQSSQPPVERTDGPTHETEAPDAAPDAPPVQADTPLSTPPHEAEADEDRAGVQEALQRETSDGPGDSLPGGNDPDVSELPDDVETPRS